MDPNLVVESEIHIPFTENECLLTGVPTRDVMTGLSDALLRQTEGGGKIKYWNGRDTISEKRFVYCKPHGAIYSMWLSAVE